MKSETKSPERQMAEKIQAASGASLILINRAAFEYMAMGLAATRMEALELVWEAVK